MTEQMFRRRIVESQLNQLRCELIIIWRRIENDFNRKCNQQKPNHFGKINTVQLFVSKRGEAQKKKPNENEETNAKCDKKNNLTSKFIRSSNLMPLKFIEHAKNLFCSCCLYCFDVIFPSLHSPARIHSISLFLFLFLLFHFVHFRFYHRFFSTSLTLCRHKTTSSLASSCCQRCFNSDRKW